MPTGTYIKGQDYRRGLEWMTLMKNRYQEYIFDVTRLYKDQFKSLLRQLQGEGLTVSRNVTADEKLGIFMAIIMKNEDYHMLHELFQHSLHTIQRAFYKVLHLI